jgi:hypothetical protein
MQNMMQWMDQQMKSCQQPPKGRQAWVRKKDEGRHSPHEGEWTHLVSEGIHA